jgi:hypothetical protein
MESLAGILAGAGANPYQQASQGIAPLLSQYLMNQQLAQGQLGQGQQQAQPGVPQQPLGLGMLSGNPQAVALMQALQNGQTP